MLIGIIIAAALIVFASGCATIGKAIDSASEKNLAAGSDTWGGRIRATFFSEESPLPNLTLSFGRIKLWYVSLKDDGSAPIIPDAIRASQSPVSARGSVNGVEITNGEPSSPFRAKISKDGTCGTYI